MARYQQGWPVKLVGDYAIGDLLLRPMVFTRLAADHCSAKTCAPLPVTGTDVDLWIGAIGPLSATIAHAEQDAVQLHFHEPLPAAVLSHFVSLEAVL